MITLRPRRTLGWNYGLALAALLAPLLAAELWVLDQPTAWPIFAATAAVLGVIVGLVWVAYRRTRVSVSKYGIVERGFFGATTVVAARDVARVLRLELYRPNSLDTTDELFVVCRGGRGRFRMRGRFWDERTMNLVAEVLEVDETTRSEPVTLAELRASDPRLLYWFERRSLIV